MLLGQHLINRLGGEPVDPARRRLAIAGEGIEHPASTTVIGGDHRIATGARILNIRQIDGLQQVQIGGTNIDVVGRVEQLLPGRLAVLALDPNIDVTTGGSRDHLHQAISVGMAHRIGVEAALGLDHRIDQALRHAVFARRFPDDPCILVAPPVFMVGHHGNIDEEDGANPQSALLHRRVEQVIGITLGAPGGADWLALVVQHLTVEERLATSQNFPIGVKIHFGRIVRRQQGLDDGATQVSAGIYARDRLHHNVAAGEVDVGPALVLIRVFDVVKLARKQRLPPPYLVHVMGERADHVFKTADVLAVDQIVILTPAGLGGG